MATEETYDRHNAKRVYYLSMEFLIGRSLANNVTNLLLDPVARHAAQQNGIDWQELLEQVWGLNCYPTTRTVDNKILELRKKLEAVPRRPVHFITMHGAGYKFMP